jgi:hypothetical protein
MRHPLSIVGAALVTLSALLFLIVYAAELFGWHTNPYIGIVFFLVMPGIFVAGLLVIPLGVWLDRRAARAGRPARRWPVLNLNNPRHLRVTAAVAVLTLANVGIVTLAAFRGVAYMDSVEFCGQVCHEVMQPEFVSYQAGPHARVACVECHIGPGAPWFVRSKLSGLRQVVAVARGSFSRPIPSPVHNLRPARDTCEHCHWPEKFHGDSIRSFPEYADDAENSESMTVMRLHVGGGSAASGPVRGIHWHTSVDNDVEYITTDEKRQVIPWVRLRTPGGTKEFVVKGASQESLQGERRRMDCMDCHNRPSHTFAASAARAVDGAIAGGQIDRGLPFVRREAVAALNENYPDRTSAAEAIGRRLHAFYRDNHPDVYGSRRPAVDRAVDATRRLYDHNVFPEMRVGWGSYENNLGHTDAPGCFRCHDDEHVAADGSVIRQDCELCHAQE